MREKLETLPLTELRAIARGKGIKNISSMKKSEVINVLLQYSENEEKEEKEQKLEEKMERWMYLNELAEQIAGEGGRV